MSHHTEAVRACQHAGFGTIARSASPSGPSGARSFNHRIATRYSAALLADGYTSLPNLAWRYYARLGVSEAEFVFLGQLCTYWWGPRDPFPGEEEIARRMCKSKRCIQGYVKSLEQKGLLRVSPRYSERGRQHTNSYDLRPFFHAIEGLARMEGARGTSAIVPPMDEGHVGADMALALPATSIPIAPTDEELGTDGTQESSPHKNLVEVNNFAFDSIPPTPATAHKNDSRSESNCERLEQRSRDGRHASDSRMDLTMEQNSALEATIQQLGIELGDDAPASSLTRVRKLASGADMSPQRLLQLVDTAADRTRARQDRIFKRRREATGVPNAMPYFFAVLTDLLRPAPTDVISDRQRTVGLERRRRRAERGSSATRCNSSIGRAERLAITETNPVWRSVLDELSLVLTIENFNTWLASTRVVAQKDDLLRVTVPRQFNKDWLEAKLNGRVMNTLQRLGYQGTRVEYVVNESS